jgi:heme exporter protein D
MLPLAHVAHYLWVLYVIPVLIVAGAILRSVVQQRRGGAKVEEGE